MRDRKGIIARQLSSIYAGLSAELLKDEGEAPRMIARAGQYIGMINGITAAGYGIAITGNGQHIIFENERGKEK